MSIDPSSDRAFRIVASTSDLTREGDTINGVIYVADGNIDFPEHGWNDAVVRILTAWCATCSAALISGAGKYEFLFQDGSFGWSAQVEPTKCGIVLFRWTGKQANVAELTTSIQHVHTEVVGAAKRIWNACEREGWREPQVSALEGAWRSLSKLGSASS